MRAIDVYNGSDGAVTRGYYADLESHGISGVIAMNLFRAQKASARAKVYRGGVAGKGSYRGMAYDKKQWAMDLLCSVLRDRGAELGIAYGWKRDPHVLFGQQPSWVLYVDLPRGLGQVSFHSPSRGEGPEYSGEWDGEKGMSEPRIVQYCDSVMGLAIEPIELRSQGREGSRSAAHRGHGRESLGSGQATLGFS
jgi:hypothetical protein